MGFALIHLQFFSTCLTTFSLCFYLVGVAQTNEARVSFSGDTIREVVVTGSRNAVGRRGLSGGSGGNHWINDGYTLDTSDDDEPKDYRFDSHDDMMGISLYQSAHLFKGNRHTLGVDFFHFGGSARNRYVSGGQIGETELPQIKHSTKLPAI